MKTTIIYQKRNYIELSAYSICLHSEINWSKSFLLAAVRMFSLASHKFCVVVTSLPFLFKAIKLHVFCFVCFFTLDRATPELRCLLSVVSNIKG